MGAMTAGTSRKRFIESSTKYRKTPGHENWHRRAEVVSPRPAMQTRRHQQPVFYLLVPTNVVRLLSGKLDGAGPHTA